MSDYQDAAWARKPGGFVIVDGREVCTTHTCCHCNNVFLSVKGSGTIRGFCRRCMAMTCGHPGCDACVPFEKRLSDYEKGLTDKL